MRDTPYKDTTENIIDENGFENRGETGNQYATKNTIAQGMLDIALLTANASQLKNILRVGCRHLFYYPVLTMIIISIIMQVITAILLMIQGGIILRGRIDKRKSEILNHVIVGFIFIASFIDVIKIGFGLEPVIRKGA